MPFNEPPAATAVPSAGAPADGGAQNSGQFAVYDGEAGPIARIAAVNAILGLFTLGIYRFWGKTRMRRHLWSRITILGDRVEYTGTPKELLLGFLVAAAIMGVVSLAFYGVALVAVSHFTLGLLNLASLAGLYFLIFFAIYRARRYRLSRTQWRGIRFGQTGSGRGYALRAMALILLTGLTFGLAYPYMQTRLQDYRTNNTWFGNRNLVFDGLAYDLFWKWVLALVLYIPTLGISFLWYKVTEFRYFASRTRFGSLSFSSTLSTMDVFLIYLVFMIVTGLCVAVLVSGITAVVAVTSDSFAFDQSGQPSISDFPPGLALAMVFGALLFTSLMNVLQFVLFFHPMIRAVTKTLMVRGTIDLDQVKQSDQERGGRGEGFADVLDVGAI